MDSINLTRPADVEAALLHPSLEPPAAPASLRAGSTADLRSAMARFNGAAAHAARRSNVDDAIAPLTPYQFAGRSERRTASIIASTASIDALSDIGFVVPVYEIALALGVDEGDLEAVRIDVNTIVEVIGRQQPSSPTTDAATSRLLGLLDSMQLDPVAAASLMYQTHDACVALFASTLLANQTSERRRPALSGTVRTATTDLSIGGATIKEGSVVSIDLETSRFEFGLGHHGCPGREIAERIVAGMIAAVDHAGLTINLPEVAWKADGRPNSLPRCASQACARRSGTEHLFEPGNPTLGRRIPVRVLNKLSNLIPVDVVSRQVETQPPDGP